MKRLAFLFAIFVSIGVRSGLAQTVQITGTIVNSADGQPLPGASVMVKGTSTGTTANFEGKYSITVPADTKTLVVSFIGMNTEEVEIAGRTVIDFNLVPDISNLNEVVVVAYGTSKKEAITGSTLQIKKEQFESKPFTDISKALEGMGPGIQVLSGSGQPGSKVDVRLRGFGSVNASSEPLYVVDGVPYTGDLSNINADDIESISVLKDASSSTLYGNKAANGVVMITTKKGTKDQHRINVKIVHGFSTRAIPEYKRVNAYQYYPLMWESYRNSMAYSSTIPIDTASLIASGSLPVFTSGPNAGYQNYKNRAYSSIKQSLGYNPFNVPDNEIVLQDGTMNPNAHLLSGYEDDLDWTDAISRVGKRDDYGVSFTGGSERSDYLISLGYLNEQGFTINSDFKRYTGRVNVNTQPKKWIKAGLNLSGTMTESNRINDASSTGYANPFYFTRNMGPIYPIHAHDPSTGDYLFDNNGNMIYDYGNLTRLGLPTRASGASVGRHVIAETYLNENLYKRNILGARTYGEFYFLKDFKFTTNIALDVDNYLKSVFENTEIGDGAPDGRGSKTNSVSTTYTFNQLLNYTKTIHDHSVEILLGHENYDYTYNYLYGSRQNLIAEGNTELINFSTTNDLTSYKITYRTEGYFSRLNYNYAGRYFGSFSYRRDGSSKFSSDARWGDFWSVGAGWRIDQENFLKPVSQVNLLKLRASYGETGNDVLLDADGYVTYYPSQSLYALNNNNANEAGVLKSSLGNKNLVWETQKNFDIGVELEIFHRLSGSFEFFHRESSNLLFSVPLPVSSGTETQDRNKGGGSPVA